MGTWGGANTGKEENANDNLLFFWFKLPWGGGFFCRVGLGWWGLVLVFFNRRSCWGEFKKQQKNRGESNGAIKKKEKAGRGTTRRKKRDLFGRPAKPSRQGGSPLIETKGEKKWGSKKKK